MSTIGEKPTWFSNLPILLLALNAAVDTLSYMQKHNDAFQLSMLQKIYDHLYNDHLRVLDTSCPDVPDAVAKSLLENIEGLRQWRRVMNNLMHEFVGSKGIVWASKVDNAFGRILTLDE